MSVPSLRLKAADYVALVEHLLQDEDEQVAFGYVRVEQDLHLEALERVQPDGFSFQSGYHIELRQEAMSQAIKRAWESNTALVEFHSHPSQIGWFRKRRVLAHFSQSDIYGFREWVPHVLWRLRRQPYLAVVVAPESFDALIWQPGDAVMNPRGLFNFLLDDGRELKPTGETLRLLSAGGYDHD